MGGGNVNWLVRLQSGFIFKLIFLIVITGIVYPCYQILLKIRPGAHSGS